LTADLPSGANGTWYIHTGNASFSDIHSHTATANNIGFGLNVLRWTVVSNGCSAYDDVQIIYNVAESHAGDDNISCNNYVTLNADQPLMGTGIWSIAKGGGSFQNNALYNTLVTNIPRGENIYRWTVTAYGIDAFDEVSVTNNSFDIDAGGDQQTCDTTVLLSAETAGTGAGIWEIYQGSGYFSDSYTNSPTVTNMFEGENLYIWTVVRNFCTAKDTVKITHYQPVTEANAGADAFICDNNAYQLTANQPVVGTGTWSATNVDITFDLPNQYNSMVRNLANGPQTIWWTISNQHCQTEDNVIISSWKTAEIISQPVNKEINEGAIFSFTIETTGDVASYQWQKDGINLSNAGRISGADSPTLIISNAVNSDQGNYQCIVTGYCNNLLSENATLSVISGFEELSKNGIKMYPNPSNGVLHIDFDELPKISSLSIYQLNGTKVFEKNQLSRKEILDLRNSSDGTYIIIIQMDNKPVRGKFIIRK
ncbi:MAG: T9SS type A sorting domain-containing protein, partial [Bacteroidales bacterium]|nr:T9SS type A sorting domain-containing protein [Bacteroidales bacterium]